MAHAVADEPQVHMGLPLSHGKLAMWLFLVTEIMFFTALIGVYMILRNGMPSERSPWPTPHDVHLEEWIGALNTFILICSSLTIVLAHLSLHHGHVKRAVQYVALTLVLGTAFIAIKFIIEYPAKFAHGIIPSHIFEKLDGPSGPEYLRHVKEQLAEIAFGSPEAMKKALLAKGHNEAELKGLSAEGLADLCDKEGVSDSHHGEPAKAACKQLRNEMDKLSPWQVNERIVGTEHVKPVDKVNLKGGQEGLLHQFAKEDLHLSYAIPYGNMWASCYFTMTGLHALHVIGGLVIFVIILLLALIGRFGTQHLALIEYTGLYWHFVDIVWIFLFPLLYLV